MGILIYGWSIAQQRLDGYAAVVIYAVRRKTVFNRRFQAKGPGEVVFRPGQVYRSDLDYTFKTYQKLLAKWSDARRVISRDANSYTVNGQDMRSFRRGLIKRSKRDCCWKGSQSRMRGAKLRVYMFVDREEGMRPMSHMWRAGTSLRLRGHME